MNMAYSKNRITDKSLKKTQGITLIAAPESFLDFFTDDRLERLLRQRSDLCNLEWLVWEGWGRTWYGGSCREVTSA
jgi:hypothetical protein